MPSSMTTPETHKDLTALREAIERLEWGQHDEAIVLCERLLGARPDQAEALCLLGLVSFDLDEPVKAIKLLEQAHAADPDLLEAAEALAAIHAKLGQVNESLYYAKLGTILEPHGQLDGLLPARLGSFFQNLDQGRPDLYLRRAQKHLEAGDLDAALADCETQLELDSGDPESLRLLARLCRLTGRSSRAIAAGHALLHGDDADARDLSELALALDAAGRSTEAEACHRSAVTRAPEDPELHGRLLESLAARPEVSRSELEREHRAWQERHAGFAPNALPPRPPWQGERPLRVAYLCGSFFDNDLMRLFEPILCSHDKAQVETYCYADGGRSDAISERLMRASTRWTDIHRIDDETVWQILQGDAIDIAVDLSGHGPGGRPLVFSKRPAPVTLSWLAPSHPPAAAELDHFLTDAVTWPEAGARAAAGAQPHRLAGGLLAFQPLSQLPDPGPLPASRLGHLTFGLQGDLRHIGTTQAEAWARVLDRLPGARLLICNLRNQDEAAMARVLDCLSHLGPRQRCDIVNYGDNFRSAYEFYGHVDVALDFGAPTGAIEVCRALWMGVPLLTLAGSRHGTRLAASLLHQAGRPEWVAETPQGLAEAAYQVTRDLGTLESLRAELRARVAGSALGDVGGFTRQLEAAYAELYRNWETSRAA